MAVFSGGVGPNAVGSGEGYGLYVENRSDVDAVALELSIGRSARAAHTAATRTGAWCSRGVQQQQQAEGPVGPGPRGGV